MQERSRRGKSLARKKMGRKMNILDFAGEAQKLTKLF